MCTSLLGTSSQQGASLWECAKTRGASMASCLIPFEERPRKTGRGSVAIWVWRCFGGTPLSLWLPFKTSKMAVGQSPGEHPNPHYRLKWVVNSPTNQNGIPWVLTTTAKWEASEDEPWTQAVRLAARRRRLHRPLPCSFEPSEGTMRAASSTGGGARRAPEFWLVA